jgi:hypothetical protein
MRTDKNINPRGIEDIFGLKLALICGPVEGDPYTDAQLERAWEDFGEKLNENMRDHPRPGMRPWAGGAMSRGAPSRRITRRP